MQPSPNVCMPMVRRWRWPWIVLGLLLGCPCLLTLLVYSAFKAGFVSVANTLPDELAQAKQLGLPITAKELRAAIALPDWDNAALDYARASAEYKAAGVTRPDESAITAFLSQKSTPAQDVLIHDFLVRTQPAVRDVQSAAMKPSLDWRRDWDSYRVRFPEYVDLKAFAKLFAVRAMAAARARRVPDAYRDIGTIYRIGMHAAKDPILIGWLVQLAIDNIATATCDEILQMNRDARSLALARQMLHAAPPIADLVDALKGEVVLTRTETQNVNRYVNPDDGVMAPPEFPERLLIRDPSFRRGMEAKAVRNLVWLAKACRGAHDWRELASRIKVATARINVDRSLENQAAEFPPLDEAAAAGGRSVAERNILATAIEVYASANKTGKLPATLPARDTTVVDPFTSRPLLYRITSDGFEIYSVDSDLRDDNGLTRADDKRSKSETHDVGRSFKYKPEAPAKR